MTARVVGIDLSLSSTGIATPAQTLIVGHPLPKTATTAQRCHRIAAIRDAVLLHTRSHVDYDDPTNDGWPLVLIEGFSFGSPQGATEAGGLGWTVRLSLTEAGIPFVIVPPSTLKKFATGKGNAGKDDMKLAAQSRLGITFTGTGSGDRCDARWLQEMGLHRLGAPTVELPAVNLSALTKVTWP